MKQIAEQQISPELLKKVAPDVVDKSGQEKLLAKTMAAHKMKDMLDKALAIASNSIGATFSSRVKDSSVVQKKIAQKRLQGRDYGIDDVGDWLGGRLVVHSPKFYDAGEKQIQEMEKQGIFKIKKRAIEKNGIYEARHFNVVMPNGLKAEIQLHTKHSESEAVANHRIYSEFGKELKGIVKALSEKQADIIDDMRPDRAKALTYAIQLITKQEGEAPAHDITAQLVKQAAS